MEDKNMRKYLYAFLIFSLLGGMYCAAPSDNKDYLSLALALDSGSPLDAGSHGLTQVNGFGSNPGALNMYTYVPANMPANAPLVVLMHGSGRQMEILSGVPRADLWK